MQHSCSKARAHRGSALCFFCLSRAVCSADGNSPRFVLFAYRRFQVSGPAVVGRCYSVSFESRCNERQGEEQTLRQTCEAARKRSCQSH